MRDLLAVLCVWGLCMMTRGAWGEKGGREVERRVSDNLMIWGVLALIPGDKTLWEEGQGLRSM